MSAQDSRKINREKAVDLLWRRGELSFLFHSAQKKLDDTFCKAPGAVVVFNVSRQFGKTFFAVTKCLSLAISRPKARIRYAAAFETDLREFVLPAFDTVLESCPEDIRPRYVRGKFLFKNGSEIGLVGLDRKPNGLRGNTIDFIVLDEAGFINKLEYLFSSVIIPLTTHRKDAKILVLSTPPESPDHDFWKYVDRAKLEGAYARFTIDENPLLGPEDIERIEREMGGRDTTAFRREYLAERIIETSRAIVPEWKPEFVGEAEHPDTWKFYQKYEALDIGVAQDKTVCLFATYDFLKARICIEDEVSISGPDMTTEKLAELIKAKERELWPNRIVNIRVSDNSHPLLNQDLIAHHELAFRRTEKDRLSEMVNKVRTWVRQGRVLVSPKCKQLLGCLESGIWDKQRSEFDRSKTYGHFDALASLVYLIRNVDEAYNPIPVTYGREYSPQEQFFPTPPYMNSNNAREFSKLIRKK